MTIQEAIEARHSVRAYKDQPLSEEIVKVFEDEIVKLNNEGQLHILYALSNPQSRILSRQRVRKGLDMICFACRCSVHSALPSLSTWRVR